MPEGAKFCASCGAAVATASSSSNAGGSNGGERRHLTVLFVDLVGSTAFADSADPEDVRELLRSYQRAAADAIESSGGTVARFQGDGLFAYFGYPEASDDAVRRAMEAALAAVDRVAALGLEARVGLDSGIVVVADMGWGARLERDDVVGDVPNIAARVQALAEPGEVLATARAFRLVRGWFESEDRGRHELKGIAAPVPVVRVVRATNVRDRLDLPGRAVPLVGRNDDLARVLSALDAEQASGRGVVAVTGDAGIGKSRLVHAAVEARAETAGVLRARCGALGSSTPLLPFLDLLRQRGETDLVGEIDSPAGTTSAATSRRSRQALVADWLASSCRLLVVEDVHWADESTLEVIVELARSTGGPLAVVTARELPVQLRDVPEVALQPLDRVGVRRLVATLAGEGVLPPQLVNRIVERSGGVPLFVEELVRSPLLRDDVDAAVPETLHDSLMARLDRLGAAKEIVQRCAVAGPSFTASEARVVVEDDVDDEALARRLDSLVADGVLVRTGAGYLFGHALLHGAAYESLLRSTRRDLHARLAKHFDEPGHAGVPPEIRAFHLEHGDRLVEAVDAWRRAARRAARRSDFPEALRDARHGIALLDRLPETNERDRAELDLQTSRAMALGLSGPTNRVQQSEAVERAMALAEKLGDRARMLPLVFMLHTSRHAAGDFSASIELAELAVDLAADPQLSYFEPFARHLLGSTLAWQGRFTAALPHLTPAADTMAAMPGVEKLDAATLSVVTTLLSLTGLTEWVTGTADGAARFQAAADIGLAADAPQSRCLTWATESIKHQLAGDVDLARATAARAIDLGSDVGNAWDEWAGLVHAWAVAASAEPAAGLADLERRIAALDPARLMLRPYFLGLLADRLLAADRLDEARATVDDALAVAARTAEGFVEAELLRLRGEVRNRAGDHEGAVLDFGEAATLAAVQGAEVFRLRALAAATAASEVTS